MLARTLTLILLVFLVFSQVTNSSSELAVCFDGFYNASAPGDCVHGLVSGGPTLDVRTDDQEFFKNIFIQIFPNAGSTITFYVEVMSRFDFLHTVSIGFYDDQKK